MKNIAPKFFLAEVSYPEEVMSFLSSHSVPDSFEIKASSDLYTFTAGEAKLLHGKICRLEAVEGNWYKVLTIENDSGSDRSIFSKSFYLKPDFFSIKSVESFSVIINGCPGNSLYNEGNFILKFYDLPSGLNSKEKTLLEALSKEIFVLKNCSLENIEKALVLFFTKINEKVNEQFGFEEISFSKNNACNIVFGSVFFGNPLKFEIFAPNLI